MEKAKIFKNILNDLSALSTAAPFIISSELTLSSRQFFNLVNSALPVLKKRYRPSERIAILSANRLEYMILLFAMWRLKIVPVLLNTRWPADYIFENLKEIKCHQIIVSSEFSFPKFKGISISSLEKLIKIFDWSRSSSRSVPEKFYLNQDASIIFTSGSTTRPKAVLHTFGNHYYNALGSNQNIRLQPGDRWLLSLPLYHVGGLGIVFRTLLAGAAIVIPDPNQNLSDSVRYQKITHLSLVATQLYWLLQDEYTIPHLQKMKAILMGGGPIPFSLLSRCSRLKIPVFVSYGSSEMASQISTTGKCDNLRKWKSSGKVLPYRELKIAPDGEIMVRGKTIAKGYIQSGKVKKVTDKSGWFHSGDLGYLNKTGNLVVIGRKDNLFISGGENIQPEEIEQYLRNIDGIEEAVVVPVPDPEFGQRPVAVIRMQEDKKYKTKDKRQKKKDRRTKKSREQEKKIERLREVEVYLREVLPGFKVPDHFLPWPEEDNSGSGLKVSRDQLQKWVARIIKRGKV